MEMILQLALKMSIQGVQPKLSVKIAPFVGHFQIVDKNRTLIFFKPFHQFFSEVPQSEDVTVRLAKLVYIDVPIHNITYNIDGSLIYFIRRFDRLGRGH